MSVEVHPHSNNPTHAWKEISRTQKVIKVNAKPPTSRVSDDKLRIVCMSDTHSLTNHIKFEIPDGDIFIHAGDFTRCGQLEEVKEFNTWIGKFDHISLFILSRSKFPSVFSNARFHTFDDSSIWRRNQKYFFGTHFKNN